MCCHGCHAVASSIIDNGLGDYYKYRSKHPITPELVVPDKLKNLQLFDTPDIQKKFIEKTHENYCKATLILEGIVCPACTWLIEKRINTLPGITTANINYSNCRATLVWDNSRIHLSDILKSVTDIGYRAFPYEPGFDQIITEEEGRAQIRRLGLAGLLGMQVMMISIALYIGEWRGIDYTTKIFFQWLSLLLTTPVFFYSALPFFKGAWRNIKQLYAGMDIPVSLGISIAFAGSIWATITNLGHVYYDTVVMFIFFLSIGRYLEFSARRKASQHIDNLNKIIPAFATRITKKDSSEFEEEIPVVNLKAGDRVIVSAGDTIPADGLVYEGKSTVDESLITGESFPVVKGPGTGLIGGSINIESPLKMEITNIGESTVLSRIIELADRVQSEKTQYIQLANRISGWFILAVLAISCLAAWYWWEGGSDIWLPIVIAVLVATCPCALSLATPAAMTVAITSLLKLGIAITRQNTIESFNRITHFIFDKTGTLTCGVLKLESINTQLQHSEKKLLAIAAALEKNSEHPVGKALIAACNSSPLLAINIQNIPGEGITGNVENKQYFLGNKVFVSRNAGLEITDNFPDTTDQDYKTSVFMADSKQLLCVFTFSDELRPHAKELVNFLKNKNIKTILLSGDKSSSVQHISDLLKFDVSISDLKPQDKLSFLENLKNQGAITAMLGDGINDAPVLSAADISIAMGSGAPVSKINADMILLNNDLEKLIEARKISDKTYRIIRQNIFWAIFYNVIILPAAFTGLIMPWMAAIGMSLSSIIVVGNASRIKN